MSCVCNAKASSTDLPTPVSPPSFLALVVVVGGVQNSPHKKSKKQPGKAYA